MATAAHDHSHDHNHDHDHDDDQELAFDPTLASCCERDEHDFQRAMKLKRLLTAHDPTSGGVRTRQQLFEPSAADLASVFPHPPSQQQQQQQALTALQLAQLRLGSDSDSDSDLDDDDDAALDAALAARRKQLEAQLQQTQRNIADGYSIVVETDWSQLQLQLRTTPAVPHVVLVISSRRIDTASVRERALLHAMQSVAVTYVGTKFAAVPYPPYTESRVSRAHLLPAAPCLVAFRQGEQVDAMPLDVAATTTTDAVTLWEARFVPWLHMCNVLATRRVDSANANVPLNRQQQRSRKEEEDEGDKEPPVNDCGVDNCRIRYGFAHEHVGSSLDARRDVAAWRS